MWNKSLIQTQLTRKLKVLLYSFGIAILTAAVNTLFLTPNTGSFKEIAVFFSSMVVICCGISLFVHLFIQAYMDYYTHFSLSMFTGKTRRQFLFSSLLTSFATLLLAVLTINLLASLLPISSLELNLVINFKPTTLVIHGLQGFFNLLLFFSFLATCIQLIALLNYRFGARIWIILAVGYTSLLLLGLSLYKVQGARLGGLFDKMISMTKGEFGPVTMQLILLFIMLVVIAFLVLRMEPVNKEQLS